jgi:hypothetical protein
MTLDVNPTLRYSLLVCGSDERRDKLPEDLVGLDSSNPKLDFRRSGALEPLKFFLKQAGQGGGACCFANGSSNSFVKSIPG